jgi:hypothetical protein
MKLSLETIKDTVPWAVHARRYARWATNQVRFPIVASALEIQSHGRIMGGLFKGLRAPPSGISPGYYTLLVGTYETSLVPIIEAIIARQPPLVVVAGAHWGYYALGIAMRCEGSHIIAYEKDRSRAEALRKYRRLNSLQERVELRGLCTAHSLAQDLASAENSVLIMDVEGDEDILLDPVHAPGLLRTEIVVELHEHLVPGVTERLRNRFARSHKQVLLPYLHTVDPCTLKWTSKHAVLKRIAEHMLQDGREETVSWLHLAPSK